MKFPALLIFLLFLPALIALGHDIYLFYVNHAATARIVNIELIDQQFKFSAFGFIWTNYAPGSYRAFASSMDDCSKQMY